MVKVVRAPHALGVAIALTSSGCSLVLDFDKKVDAGPPDSPVADTACMMFEPNDDVASATALAAGDHMAAICGRMGETDYFKIHLSGTQSVLARITFENRMGLGDLDLRLLNTTGSVVIDESTTNDNMEEVMCPGGVSCASNNLAAGDYIIHVRGFTATVESAYTLHLELGP